MSLEEPIISDSLMGLAMEYRFLVIDEIRKTHPNIVVPQLRAAAGHHRSFSIVPGGKKSITVHSPTTRKRTYEFFVVSVMDLFEAVDEDNRRQVAEDFGGVAPSNRHVEGQAPFTGDTDADPFRGRFSLGALYEVSTAIRRGGGIGEEVNMEFSAKWQKDKLQKIVINLVYPTQEAQSSKPEIHGKRLPRIETQMANQIAETCLERMRTVAEEKYRISPGNLEPYINLDQTGTQVFGIGLRKWLT